MSFQSDSVGRLPDKDFVCVVLYGVSVVQGAIQLLVKKGTEEAEQIAVQEHAQRAALSNAESLS